MWLFWTIVAALFVFVGFALMTAKAGTYLDVMAVLLIGIWIQLVAITFRIRRAGP